MTRLQAANWNSSYNKYTKFKAERHTRSILVFVPHSSHVSGVPLDPGQYSIRLLRAAAIKKYEIVWLSSLLCTRRCDR